MSAKNLLGGKEEKKEAARRGSGTRVSGYVESPTPKECRTCEYFTGKNLCRNSQVLRDPEVKKDQKSHLKIVAPVAGCCDHWEPEK